MAQKTVVTVLCDLPHDSEVEGTESISFTVGGNAYQIDLCPPHSEEFGTKVGAFAELLTMPVPVKLKFFAAITCGIVNV